MSMGSFPMPNMGVAVQDCMTLDLDDNTPTQLDTDVVLEDVQSEAGHAIGVDFGEDDLDMFDGEEIFEEQANVNIGNSHYGTATQGTVGAQVVNDWEDISAPDASQPQRLTPEETADLAEYEKYLDTLESPRVQQFPSQAMKSPALPNNSQSRSDSRRSSNIHTPNVANAPVTYSPHDGNVHTPARINRSDNLPTNPSNPLYPVTITYGGSTMSLFPSNDRNDSEFFLNNISLVEGPLEGLFKALRAVLGDSLHEEDELVMDFAGIDLCIYEDSSHCSDPSKSLEQVMTIYDVLYHCDPDSSDKKEQEPLHITLSTCTRFSTRFDQLMEAASESIGLSKLTFRKAPEGSGSGEEVNENDHSNENDGDDGGEYEEEEIGENGDYGEADNRQEDVGEDGDYDEADNLQWNKDFADNAGPYAEELGQDQEDLGAGYADGGDAEYYDDQYQEYYQGDEDTIDQQYDQLENVGHDSKLSPAQESVDAHADELQDNELDDSGRNSERSLVEGQSVVDAAGDVARGSESPGQDESQDLTEDGLGAPIATGDHEVKRSDEAHAAAPQYVESDLIDYSDDESVSGEQGQVDLKGPSSGSSTTIQGEARSPSQGLADASQADITGHNAKTTDDPATESQIDQECYNAEPAETLVLQDGSESGEGSDELTEGQDHDGEEKIAPEDLIDYSDEEDLQTTNQTVVTTPITGKRTRNDGEDGTEGLGSPVEHDLKRLKA